jgi:hypothetical protein
MAIDTAKSFFKEYLLTPASATWTDLINGTRNSITGADFSGNLWNLSVCSVPVIAGRDMAYRINRYAHTNCVRKLPRSSVVFTTVSCIAGVTASFLAIRILSTLGVALSPFTADKIVRLTALYTVVAAATPISKFFGITLPFFTEGPTVMTTFAFDKSNDGSSYSLGITLPLFTGPMILGAAAAAGYFGERSLYVIGALSALTGAVTGSFSK